MNESGSVIKAIPGTDVIKLFMLNSSEHENHAHKR